MTTLSFGLGDADSSLESSSTHTIVLSDYSDASPLHTSDCASTVRTRVRIIILRVHDVSSFRVVPVFLRSGFSIHP